MGTLVVVVTFKIERDNQTRLHLITDLAFNENETFMGLENALIKIFLHGLLAFENAVFYVRTMKPGFGEDQVEG